MPRVNDARCIARREEVLALWTRGATVNRIATTLKLDWRTVKRDVAFVAQQAVDDLNVPQELARLLASAKAVELDCWAAKQPMQALAAVKAQLAVLSVLQGIDLAQRVAELEQRLDALQGVNPWQSVHTRAEHRAGRN